MGRKASSGLRVRHGVYHIEKRILGIPVFESCKTGNLTEAEAYLAKRTDEIRQAKLFGVRPRRTWREVSIEYLRAKKKRSLADDALHLKALDPFIGHLSIDQVHDGTLKAFKDSRRKKGIKVKSVNNALSVVRHILNLCAQSWRDENGLTWLLQAPKITLDNAKVDAAKSYPLLWIEQNALFDLLPCHLHRMALFKVNTGTREQEVCQLSWEWEVPVPEIERSVFIVPEHIVKNAEERVIVPNDIAWGIIKLQRGLHPVWVFPYGRKDENGNARPLKWMNNSAWKSAWKLSGLPVGPEVKHGVHNLKHTFGRRLRAAGVPLETRRVLLGHTNGDITTHYSQAEFSELLNAANKVCQRESGKTPAITLLRRARPLLRVVNG